MLLYYQIADSIDDIVIRYGQNSFFFILSIHSVEYTK